MTFTFTQQIETTQNAIVQLNQKLDFYSQTDEYLIQSENLLHSVTELFEEKDLQIIRDRLQDLWSIENTTAEIESRDTKIVELQNKIKSLEFNLETALTQRDRSTKKYNELLKQSIDSSPEIEFLDTFHELCTNDESPQVELEELESRGIETFELATRECVAVSTPEEEEGELLHKFLVGNLDLMKDYELSDLVEELGLSPVFPQCRDSYLRAIYRELEKRGYQIYSKPPAPAPLDLRVKDFIKSFKDDSTTWDDLKGFALNDPKFFQKLTMARSKKLGRIKEALPKMLASHIQEHGRSDKTWVGTTLWGLAEKEVKTRYQQAKNTPELTVEDAVREKTLDWECEVEKVVDDLLKPQSFNSVMVKRISRDLFARYPDNLEVISSKLFELLTSSNPGSVVYVWVEDAYKEYQKNTLVAA